MEELRVEVSDVPGALNFAVAEGLAELPEACKTGLLRVFDAF